MSQVEESPNPEEEKAQPQAEQPEEERVVMHGDFAAGERTSDVDVSGPDFARGEDSGDLGEPGGDFAAGERTLPRDPDAEPDFARGQDAA